MMSREERSRRFSVDCPDRVVWKHWSAGGEYVKKLIVKNTFDKLQVLEYKLPQRKATFFVDFPAPVTLSSGMAFELEIKFRPTEMVELHDSIELSVKGRGSFFVQLDALVPYAAIAAPEKHDFEFCAVGTTVEAKAPLKNVGTLPVDYYWDVPAPFQVSPKQGSLEEGATQTMQLSFTPSAALSMVGQAVCKRVGDDVVLGVMKLSGIGKFAFVTFDHGTPESVVDFGEALSQSTNTKVITLMNKSFVPGKFTIKRIDKDIVCPFVLSPMSGTVPRDGLVKIQVKFQPTGSGAELSNSFVLHVAGGNTLRLNCLGTSVGPTAALSTTKVEFGDVNLDTLAADSSAKQNSSSGILDRFVTLKNTTNAAIRFQAVGTNPGAVFAVTPFSGQVPAKGSVALKVTFRPEAPMNYLRRLFILINDTERALYCDFVATAYNSKSRPAPFTAADARAFFTRLEVGLGKCSPDDIAQLIEGIRSGAPAASEDEEAARQAMQLVLQEKESQLAATQADATAASSSSKKKAAAPTLDPSRSVSKTFKASRRVVPLQTILPEEEHGATTAPFVLDRSVLVFQTAASSADGEVVHVRNNTSAKATASWAIPADTPWSVVPASQDVAPFSTAAFRVRMANQGNGAPYGNASSVGHFLECFVNFKQMRSFRLVNEDTHCPPHCLLLQCQRLVAMTDTAATPQVDAVSQVAFPPCHERSKVLQVVTLRNMGDTVAAFRVQIETQTLRAPQLQQEGIIVDDELAVPATVFSCFPSTGVIPPKESTLVLLTFSPPTADRFVGMAKVLLNDSPLGSLQIALRGEGFVPSLQLESDGVLTFRPTSVGGCTTRSFHLTNPSRIPVRFEATVPSALADVVRLQPSSGVLKGCEKLAIQAQFYPQQARRYDTSLVFAITAEQPPNSVLDSNGQPPVSRMTCHVQGEGMLGVVAVEPLTLSYGNFLVGESGTQQLSIINSSLCDLQYDTRWCIRSGTMEEGVTAPEFINGRGVIRARSHVNVHVTIKPVRGSFEFLLYVLVGGHEDIYQAPDPPLQEVLRMPHCIATATGAYPSIQITDVRSVLQPKSLLWRQLSVGKINASLAESVTPSVDLENCAYNFLQQVEGLEAIHVDVGVDVFRSPPMKVLVRLDNVGLCRATYSIRLPDESDIPTEPWHHEKLLEDNLSEVLDARLLDIQPREASIEAGGHILLTISYRHTRVGHHQLPVLLRLNKGKKVLLVLHARTLDEGGKYLRFHHSMQHAFAPVAIGELEPPLQYTELQNLSQNAVSYALDESALAQLQEANYDFPILQCLNPAGVIPPMSTLLLSWYFRPLEPKSYEATVRVQVEGSQDYSLVLQGRGFHPKKCTPEEIQQMHRDSFLSIPKYPTLSHPLLPMRLSMDVLRFGAVPFHSLHRQMVTLRNDHQRDTFVFEWHCVLQFGDQIFDVDPPRGRLAPGESVHCRITLYTGSTSHIIDNPIHCHVLNESLRERRAAKRAVANKEAAMQLDAPHITPEGSAAGDAAASSRRTTRKVGGGAAPRIRQPVVGIPPKFQTTERLKETIQKVTDAVVGEDVSEDADELAEVEVLPTVLELLVQARIVSLEAFHEVYGELASRSMFFPTLQAFTSRIEPSDCIDLSRNATEQEWRLAHEVLDTLLKQAVHHHRIEESFLDAGEDPIPYFCEMSTTTTNDITAPLLAVRTASSSEGPETSQDETTAATSTATAAVGEERCLAEEVLESAIFSLVKGICDADESMVKSIFKRRQ